MNRLEDPLASALASALARRQASDTLRIPHPMRRSGMFLERLPHNRFLVDLSSNDYLALSQHPLLRTRAAEWAARYGTGAASSRLVTGTLELHTQLEEKLATFKQSEAALLFATGWQANASIIPALNALSRQETGQPAEMFCDRLNHASLHHGCAAAGLRQKRFRHNDLAHLRQLLAQADAEGTAGLRFIVTESVFSMDGDRADLPALRALADEYNAYLYVDDAHATGILGPEGRGLTNTNAGKLADLCLSTASKGLGGMGAFVTGSAALCSWLFNQASGLVYSTALPPAVLGALDAALEVVPEMETARTRVAKQAENLRTALHLNGWDCCGSTTQVVPLLVGRNADALALGGRLEEKGFLALPIRPPTVPNGTARLRFSLHAGLEDSHIEQLVSCLGKNPTA